MVGGRRGQPALRDAVAARFSGLRVVVPPFDLCTDNAAMIGAAGLAAAPGARPGCTRFRRRSFAGGVRVDSIRMSAASRPRIAPRPPSGTSRRSTTSSTRARCRVPGRLAEWLGVSAPTVTVSLQRLARDGLIRIADDRSVELTEGGAEAAALIVRRHRIVERWLTDVLGFDWATADLEAQSLSHGMSMTSSSESTNRWAGRPPARTAT